jgi:hypothetical protein
MKIIPVICRGKEYEIMVDDEDYILLSRHRWYLLDSGKSHYAYASFYTGNDKCKMIPMSHIILGSTSYVDHIDNNPLNNQKANLRKATRQQNNMNKPKAPNKQGKPTSSKYKGVQKYGAKGRFRAMIGFNRKVIQLGSFDTEDEAGAAYNDKAIELFGRFAWLNPVPNYKRSKGGES